MIFLGIFYFFFFVLVLWVFPGNLHPQQHFVVFLFPPSSLGGEEILGQVEEPTAQDPVATGPKLTRPGLSGVVFPSLLPRVQILALLPRVQILALLPRVQASAMLPRVYSLSALRPGPGMQEIAPVVFPVNTSGAISAFTVQMA